MTTQYMHSERCISLSVGAVGSIPSRGLAVEIGHDSVEAALGRASFDVLWHTLLLAAWVELQVSDRYLVSGPTRVEIVRVVAILLCLCSCLLDVLFSIFTSRRLCSSRSSKWIVALRDCIRRADFYQRVLCTVMGNAPLHHNSIS